MWVKHGKTIITHPPVITVFIGGMVTIPSHGWFMTLFYPTWFQFPGVSQTLFVDRKPRPLGNPCCGSGGERLTAQSWRRIRPGTGGSNLNPADLIIISGWNIVSWKWVNWSWTTWLMWLIVLLFDSLAGVFVEWHLFQSKIGRFAARCHSTGCSIPPRARCAVEGKNCLSANIGGEMLNIYG